MNSISQYKLSKAVKIPAFADENYVNKTINHALKAWFNDEKTGHSQQISMQGMKNFK